MKQLKASLLLPFVLMLAACGGMGNGGTRDANMNASNTMNGNWSTTMMNSSGAQMMVFTSALNESSSSVVTASNLQFTTPTSCFMSGTSGTGAVMLNSSMNGSMTGSFGMTIQSAMDGNSGSMGMEMGMTTTGNNVLTLQGSMSNMNTVSGTWMMSGVTSGCSGSGNFTMTRM
jgi:hypothetical protein